MIEFEIKGLNVLSKALLTLPRNVARRVSKGALRAGGRVIAKDAKKRVAVDSGDTKKSIKIKTGRKVVFVTAGSFDAYYAHMIEHGTSKMPAQPFLRPALDTTRGPTLKAIGDKLGEGIIKETNKL